MSYNNDQVPPEDDFCLLNPEDIYIVGENFLGGLSKAAPDSCLCAPSPPPNSILVTGDALTSTANFAKRVSKDVIQVSAKHNSIFDEIDAELEAQFFSKGSLFPVLEGINDSFPVSKTHYIVYEKDDDELMKEVHQFLDSCNDLQYEKNNFSSGYVSCSVFSKSNFSTAEFKLNIYSMKQNDKSAHLLEFRRVSGDLLLFSKYFRCFGNVLFGRFHLDEVSLHLDIKVLSPSTSTTLPVESSSYHDALGTLISWIKIDPNMALKSIGSLIQAKSITFSSSNVAWNRDVFNLVRAVCLCLNVEDIIPSITESWIECILAMLQQEKYKLKSTSQDNFHDAIADNLEKLVPCFSKIFRSSDCKSKRSITLALGIISERLPFTERVALISLL